ncbi:MAG: 4-(cytidine 5'-diphospho)-2-C-methyl-D-erythritol kinase [Chlorobi bacterium]|nr:4-(cytidine 5'-diphospho)-2-C-methyl-D-erythritol kinase [Chlorobiota bacterium]
MICFPNAKINLGLRILQKRDDGFHDIQSCIVPIPLCDVMEIHESGQFKIEVFGAVMGANPKDNIIYKTWEKLNDSFDIPAFEVKLIKNIPLQSGLGGGSSDAAFFLKEVNAAYGLGITDDGMEMFLESLGSDCPFFVRNRIAMAYSKGEALKGCELDLSGLHLTIIKPDHNISTSTAYGKVVPNSHEKPLSELLKLPLPTWKDNVFNDFEKTVVAQMPELSSIKGLLYDSGAEYVSLSGSGSAIYALSVDKLDVSGVGGGFIRQAAF